MRVDELVRLLHHVLREAERGVERGSEIERRKEESILVKWAEE